MGKRSDFWVLGVNGLDCLLFVSSSSSSCFSLLFNSFFPLSLGGWTHTLRRAGDDRLEIGGKQQAGCAVDGWVDGWMDGLHMGLGSSVLGRYDGGLLVVGFGSMAGWIGGCRFNNINKTRHLGIMRREGGVFLVCVISLWLLLSGFLLARLVSCALLGWMDGATLHNTTPPACAESTRRSGYEDMYK